MKDTALLIIDMQTALLEAHPYDEGAVVARIQRLLDQCRKNEIPVIFVSHDGGVGDELERGSAGWQICSGLMPDAGEKIIDKTFNSAFRQTPLESYLQSLGIKTLILCGMQTEYCFDVSCKVAFEKGYEVIVPRGTTTTFDNDFCSAEKLIRYYEDKIWNDRYATVKDVDEVLSLLSK